MKKGLMALAVIVVVGVGIFALTKKSNTPTTSSTSTTSTSSSSQASGNTISFDGSSFSPSTLTVASGTVVTIKNTSSGDLQMDSNPHPVHTDDTDLNVGAVTAGQSKTFTVTKKGSFGYHDHLDPSITASITIN